MDKKDKLILIGSIILSILIWGFLQSWSFSLVLVFSILVHEYGHYLCMGWEGIKNKKMLMIPPFGAIAVAKEPWNSYGAEARIALAGPFFGFIPVLIFLGLASLTDNKLWMASVGLGAFINVFNLIPIGPLDGGRCLNAIFTSCGRKFRILTGLISMILITLLFINGFILISMLIGYFFFREEMQYAKAQSLVENRVHHIQNISRSDKSHDEKILELASFERVFEKAQQIYNMPAMSVGHVFLMTGAYMLIAHLHITAMFWAINKLNLAHIFELFIFFI